MWRYSRISQLDLDRFTPLVDRRPASFVLPEALLPDIAAAGERAGLLVAHNGRIVHAELDPALRRRGVVLGNLAAVGESSPAHADSDVHDALGSVVTAPPDAFYELNSAFATDPVLVRVPSGVTVDQPLLVYHWVDRPGVAIFPRLIVQVGADAEVTVLDHHSSPVDLVALTVPITELDVADAGRLRYLNVQDLGPQVWQLAYQASRAGQDATLRASAVALGGDYARLRTDSRLEGQGGSSELLAIYYGEGDQMHDFRTMQDHVAPHTTSNLLFKGAVEDRSRGVYSGLIRVRKTANGTNAFQTNRNLVLSEGASAESVPNLEIENNDVQCSHASAVGPIDADQSYYLQSRGVPSAIAERLIVLGFFDDILVRLPVPQLHPHLHQAMAAKLERRSD